MIRASSPGLIALWREDFRTHGCDWTSPGFRALFAYRLGVWRMSIRSRIIRAPISVIYKMLYRRAAHVYGIEIPYTAKIGRRVRIEHQHCIVIHGASEIGDECVIRHGVTLGIRDENLPDEAPSLGIGVSVGAGAKILGKVTVGDNVKIGANAVVLHDVDPNSVVVGIPARVVRSNTMPNRNALPREDMLR